MNIATSRLANALAPRVAAASGIYRIPAAATGSPNAAASLFYRSHLSRARCFAATAGGQGGPVRRGNGALETLTAWVWRGVYVLTGAGIAVGGVMLVTNPQGMMAGFTDVRTGIEDTIQYYTEPSREKLLPDVKSPYPGAPPPRTLVLDLDETLIYTSYSRSTGWRVAKRPGAEAFLAYLCNFYEIVVFSDKLDMYVNPILHTLDPNGYISHRLYRSETKFVKGNFVKDLSVLNRDLSRVIVIDHNIDKSLLYHPDNGIKVSKWNGDPNDTTLLDLVPFLESLSKEDVADVREHLAILRERGIQDGVRAHKGSAPERLLLQEEKLRNNNTSTYLFGATGSSSLHQHNNNNNNTTQPPPADGQNETSKTASKGAVRFSSKLFRPQTKLELPDEAQDLKNKR